MNGHREMPPSWLRGLQTYLAVVIAANFVWEGLQLPLYTIWHTGTLRDQAFAVVHCSLGDALIAVSTLMLGLLIAGDERWPPPIAFGKSPH
jgi:hypothetical protein